jgi:hypothetical protein
MQNRLDRAGLLLGGEKRLHLGQLLFEQKIAAIGLADAADVARVGLWLALGDEAGREVKRRDSRLAAAPRRVRRVGPAEVLRACVIANLPDRRTAIAERTLVIAAGPLRVAP